MHAAGGGFGYLPQDSPHRRRARTARTAVTHILSGRGIDAELERIEKLRIAMEERAERAQRRPLQPRPGECSRTTGRVRRATARRGGLAAGLGISPTASTCPIARALGGERPPRRAGRILFAGSDALLCLDEPTNHLDVRRQDVADGVPAAPTAGPCS